MFSWKWPWGSTPFFTRKVKAIVAYVLAIVTLSRFWMTCKANKACCARRTCVLFARLAYPSWFVEHRVTAVVLWPGSTTTTSAWRKSATVAHILRIIKVHGTWSLPRPREAFHARWVFAIVAISLSIFFRKPVFLFLKNPP